MKSKHPRLLKIIDEKNLVFVAEIFSSQVQKYFHLSFCNFLRSNPILTSTTFFPYKCRTARVSDDDNEKWSKSSLRVNSQIFYFISAKSWLPSSKSCVFNLFNFQQPLLIAILKQGLKELWRCWWKFTSGHSPHVWFGVMTTLVVTKKAPFSAGGTT